MAGLRDEAEALAEALELGLCAVVEVIAWSDAQILREDPPPGALCEVSLAYNRSSEDVAGLLRQCPGTSAKSNVNRLLVTLLDHRLKGDTSRAYQVASALYQMAISEEIEEPNLREVAWWAWDALDLAEAGLIDESREQIVGRMADALDRASADTSTTWSFGVAVGKPSA